MQANEAVQGLNLREFFIGVATNPSLQMKFSTLTNEELLQSLVGFGMPEGDAQLLVNAHSSSEGRVELSAKLTQRPFWKHGVYIPDSEE